MDGRRFREAELRLWQSLGLTPVEHDVDLPRIGGRIRVQELGDGPPVLFVHGASVAGACWATLAAALPDHRCLLIDRPGCGESPPLADPPVTMEGLRRFADRLVGDCLDGLGLDRAVVVATSFGGWMALRSAAAEPERVERLGLLGFTVGATPGPVPVTMRIGSVPWIAKGAARIPPTRAMVRRLLEDIGLRDAVRSGAFTDEMHEWFFSLVRDTPTLQNDATTLPRVVTLTGWNDDVLLGAEVLDRVVVPVRMLWGDHDPFGGEDVARRFAAMLPRAEVEVFGPAGHAPWMDDAERAAALIRSLTAPPADRHLGPP